MSDFRRGSARLGEEEKGSVGVGEIVVMRSPLWLAAGALTTIELRNKWPRLAETATLLELGYASADARANESEH